MSAKKRGRKMRSARKLLRKQKVALTAMHHCSLTVVTAMMSMQVQMVQAAKFAKGGQAREACDTIKAGIGEIVLLNEGNVQRAIDVERAK